MTGKLGWLVGGPSVMVVIFFVTCGNKIDVFIERSGDVKISSKNGADS